MLTSPPPASVASVSSVQQHTERKEEQTVSQNNDNSSSISPSPVPSPSRSFSGSGDQLGYESELLLFREGTDSKLPLSITKPSSSSSSQSFGSSDEQPWLHNLRNKDPKEALALDLSLMRLDFHFAEFVHDRYSKPKKKRIIPLFATTLPSSPESSPGQ